MDGGTVVLDARYETIPVICLRPADESRSVRYTEGIEVDVFRAYGGPLPAGQALKVEYEPTSSKGSSQKHQLHKALTDRVLTGDTYIRTFPIVKVSSLRKGTGYQVVFRARGITVFGPLVWSGRTDRILGKLRLTPVSQASATS